MELNAYQERLEAKLDKLRKFELIQAELERAIAKHPEFPSNLFEQLAIMQEEAGEVAKACLHYKHEGGTVEDIRDELIQTAAMCMRMLQAL